MGRYRRTVSFPNPPAANFRPAGKKSYHVRSASLPCNRTHPLIPQLRDEANELQSWTANNDNNRSGSVRVCEGLARLKGVLDSLDDVLQLPQTQDSLSSGDTPLVENLLEDFLRFVDSYGIFRASVLGLKQELSGAQVAIRRKDASKLGLHLKAQKKIAIEIGKLVSAVGSVSEHQILPCTLATPDHKNRHLHHDDSEDTRLVIRDVHRLTSSVSAGLFAAVSGSFGSGRRPVWAGLGLGIPRMRHRKESVEDQVGVIGEFQEVIGEVENLIVGLKKPKEIEEEKRKKNEEMRMGVLKRMQEMEDSVGEMERESERVFRSLISTRVSLLNILTHA